MSTYVMCCEIIFPTRETRKEIILRKVESVTVQTSWKLLTDTAEMTIPRRSIAKIFDSGNIREVFKRGDRVIIKLGYNGILHEEFKGYITQVSANIPLKIKFEDEMWKVKQIPVNFSAKQIVLEELLKKIVPNYTLDVFEGVSLGGVRFAKTNMAKVLDKIRSSWKLYSYMKDKTLVCGKIYSDDSNEKAVTFLLEHNAVSNDLQYKKKEETLIKIKGVSLLKNGDKIQVEVGQEGGSIKQLSYYNIGTTRELKILVEKDYERIRQDGFDGSFTAFGTPRVQHGWKVDLTSKIYGDQNGVYYIESVTKEFSNSGYRQIIKLGDRVSDNVR